MKIRVGNDGRIPGDGVYRSLAGATVTVPDGHRCEDCDRVFTTVQGLASHGRTHEPSDVDEA